jgi:hypothetical protein
MFILTQDSPCTIPAHMITWKRVRSKRPIVVEVRVAEITAIDTGPTVGLTLYPADMERHWKRERFVDFKDPILPTQIPQENAVSVDLLVSRPLLVHSLAKVFERLIAFSSRLEVTCNAKGKKIVFTLIVGDKFRRTYKAPFSDYDVLFEVVGVKTPIAAAAQ